MIFGCTRITIHARISMQTTITTGAPFDPRMRPRDIGVNRGNIIAVRLAIRAQACAHRLGELSFAQITFKHRKSPGLSVVWRRRPRRRKQKPLDSLPFDRFRR